MEVFNKIIGKLKGLKTYIIIALMLIVSILEQEGVIDMASSSTYLEYLTYGGGATLVAKLNRFASAGAA